MDILLLGIIAIWISLVMARARAIQRFPGQSGWIDTVLSAAVGIGGVVVALFSHRECGRRIVAMNILHTLAQLQWAIIAYVGQHRAQDALRSQCISLASLMAFVAWSYLRLERDREPTRPDKS